MKWVVALAWEQTSITHIAVVTFSTRLLTGNPLTTILFFNRVSLGWNIIEPSNCNMTVKGQNSSYTLVSQIKKRLKGSAISWQWRHARGMKESLQQSKRIMKVGKYQLTPQYHLYHKPLIENLGKNGIGIRCLLFCLLKFLKIGIQY